MKYIESWPEIQKRIESSKIYGEMMAELEDDVASWMQQFHDNPEESSGWGHQYFCADDGGKLIFNMNTPHNHMCSVCGRSYSGGVYDGAWICIYRYEAILSAYKAAVLFKLNGNWDYLDYVKKVLIFYSSNYEAFQIHGKGDMVAGSGKIMPQALNEAIFLVKTVHILELLKDDLEEGTREIIINQLLIPGAWFVEKQKHLIHNISCWINTAVGMVGYFTQDQKLIESAIGSEYGLTNQLRKGVTADYFWYEGSMHYNCFTLESLVNLLLFAKLYGYDLPEEMEVVRSMFTSAFQYAFDNMMFPNPNDGWPNISLKTYSFLYEMAAKIYGTQEFAHMLASIYDSPLTRHGVPLSQPYYYKECSLESLLFGQQWEKTKVTKNNSQSYNFTSSNFAILKNEYINTFIKYGHKGPSHAHPDKMNIEMMAFGKTISRDLSNCGYGAKLCNEWYRTTVSHNTVVVDGKNQDSTNEGCTLSFNKEQGEIKVFAENVYPNVNFERQIIQQDTSIQDRFITRSDEVHTYDWVFHGDGCLSTEELKLSKAELGFKVNGYQHLLDIQKTEPMGDRITLYWNFGDGVGGEQEIDLTNKQIFFCKSYDNPVNGCRDTVIVRQIDKQAVFHINWKFYPMANNSKTPACTLCK